jgi:outer membrane protein OmpA-like peptidoglycan-associated protein
MKKNVLLILIAFFTNTIFANNILDPIKVIRKKYSLYIFVPTKLFPDKETVKLIDSDKYELGVIANGLIENKDVKIEVSVYYDTTLDPEGAKNFTQKRAEIIRDYLTVCGANPDNILAKGYGDSVIINKCKPFVKCTPAEHAVNRRVEFKILNPEKLINFKMVKK